MATYRLFKSEIPGQSINSWHKFERKVRSPNGHLLSRLDDFPNAVLVAGCQRSGTTMVSRAITQSDGMVNFQFGKDDELDAALILSGNIEHEPNGRYCFQTTYLNDHYPEYYHHKNFKLIWVIRNPYSVIFSMVHNWRRGALNRLFDTCGITQLDGIEKKRYENLGSWSISRIHKACLSYNAKMNQLYMLMERLGPERMMVVDYEELAENPDSKLPEIYQFSELQYKDNYAKLINGKSMSKAEAQGRNEAEMVGHLCLSSYLKAKSHIHSPLESVPKSRHMIH